MPRNKDYSFHYTDGLRLISQGVQCMSSYTHRQRSDILYVQKLDSTSAKQALIEAITSVVDVVYKV